jgi:hypothetical protein
VNSRGETYVQVRADVKKDECDIVRLMGMGVKKKKSILEAQLLSVAEHEDGGYIYCYKMPEIAFKVKKGQRKGQTLRAVFTIWSKKIDVTGKAR